MKEDNLLTVKEFADLTGRFTNYIYVLIKHGNKHRKLNAKKVNGKWMIPSSELDQFPFTDDKVILERLITRIEKMESKLSVIINDKECPNASIKG